MSLFLSLLPLYLFGNIHCLGMCGPLVMLISRHPHRFFYFLGRICSFTLAGWLAAMSGEVVQLFLQDVSVSALPSLFLGGWIVLMASQVIPKQLYQPFFHSAFWRKIEQNVTFFALNEHPMGMFLFGMSTLLLPCGQTLIVFAACALTADPWEGLINGLSFALLTSPALFLALKMGRIFAVKAIPSGVLAIPQIFVGVLLCWRGLAELGWIPHLVLYQSDNYHLGLF